MLSSVLSLFHSPSVCLHMLSHTSPTHSTPVFVKADVVSAKKMASFAVRSSLVSGSLDCRIISSELINRSSYWLQVKEIDTEFNSTKMVDFQSFRHWPSMKKLPTKSVSELYFSTFNGKAAVCRISIFVLQYTASPHPVSICDFCVVPESLFGSPPKVSLGGWH